MNENQQKFISDIREAIEHLKNIGNLNASYTLKAIYDELDRSFPSEKIKSLEFWMNTVTNIKFSESIGKDADLALSWIDGNETLRDRIKRGRKIECIKIIRDYTGYGLAEAKNFLDANWERWQQRIKDEDESNGSVA